VQNAIHVEDVSRRTGARRCAALGLLVLAAGLAPIAVSQARGAAHASSADQLAIQVTDDRLTLAVTDVPQVYLYGTIDEDAPQRVGDLIRSGKIPRGSDIYLNSSSGSVGAGMALGRLFRAGSMVTHLGKPRRKGESNTAICVGACTYAYFGGLYRWAPTGSDRIGVSAYPAAASPNGSGDIAGYLKDMGIDPAALTTSPSTSSNIATSSSAVTSSNATVWLSADQMMASGLANNGRLPLVAKYQTLSTGPYLTLEQTDRHGEHRMTIECKPGRVILTAINQVGAERARDIVARGTRSYFELNRQEILTQPSGGVEVASASISMTRTYPPARLQYIIYAPSVGAWVAGRTSAFRNGFTFELEPVRSTLKQYYEACWQAAPWPTTKQNS
jgi:hypothetical protein